MDAVAFGCSEEERRSELGIKGFSDFCFSFVFEFWFRFTFGAAEAALVFIFVLCAFRFGSTLFVVGLPLFGPSTHTTLSPLLMYCGVEWSDSLLAIKLTNTSLSSSEID